MSERLTTHIDNKPSDDYNPPSSSSDQLLSLHHAYCPTPHQTPPTAPPHIKPRLLPHPTSSPAYCPTPHQAPPTAPPHIKPRLLPHPTSSPPTAPPHIKPRLLPHHTSSPAYCPTLHQARLLPHPSQVKAMSQAVPAIAVCTKATTALLPVVCRTCSEMAACSDIMRQMEENAMALPMLWSTKETEVL